MKCSNLFLELNLIVFSKYSKQFSIILIIILRHLLLTIFIYNTSFIKEIYIYRESIKYIVIYLNHSYSISSYLLTTYPFLYE